MTRRIRAVVTHGFLLSLSAWAVYAQFVNRTPSRIMSVLLPSLCAATSLLTFVVLLNNLVRGVKENDPYRVFFGCLERALGLAVMSFVFLSLFLFTNAKFDRAFPVGHATEILSIGGPEGDVVPSLPITWANIRSWRRSGGIERVLLRDDERRLLWGGQAVVVSVQPGLYGVPWVSSIEIDEEKRSREVLTLAPFAAEVWKNLANFYVRQRRYADARITAAEYLTRFPDDYRFAIHIGTDLLNAKLPSEVATLFEPMAARHERADVYMYYGYGLAISGRNPQEGIRYLKAASEKEPWNWWPYYVLGWAYSGSANYGAAVVNFEEALKRRPGLADAERELQRIRPLAANRPPPG